MTATPIIETQRLILRRPNPGDTEAAVRFYTSQRAQYAGGNVSVGQAWRNFAMILGHWEIHGFGLWAVTLRGDDTALGMVGPYFPQDWPERELGWVLFDGAEGKGIAHKAVIAARAHVFDTLGWTTAVSYIAPENHRSVALAERLGATLDTQAQQPKPDQPCLIYRHPSPQRTDDD